MSKLFKKFLISTFFGICLMIVSMATSASSAKAQNAFTCAWNGAPVTNHCQPNLNTCDSGNSVDPNFCAQFRTVGDCNGKTSTCVAGTTVPPLSTPPTSTTTSSEPGPWYNQTFQEWHSKVYDNPNESEIYGERYTAAQVQWVIYSLFSFIIDNATGKELSACILANKMDDCKTILESKISASKLLETNLIANKSQSKSIVATIFEDRPISAIHYFKNLGRKFHFIPEVQAQTPGFGFNGLDTVLDMWKAVRDVTYALFVLIVIAVAFMIMFRVKISPQIVISVQSALPKIVVGLVLVTFSYAIAGFIVDLMYVLIGLISTILPIFYRAVAPNWVANLASGSLFGDLTVMNIFTWVGLYSFFFVTLGLLSLAVSGGIVGAAATVGATAIVAGVLAFLAPGLWFIYLIIFIVALIAYLWTAIKIIWMLLKAFAQVLLLTIFAPLQIAFGIVIPSLGFSSWLKSFVSNLVVFPLVGLLFELSFIFLLKAVDIAMASFGPSTKGFLMLLVPGINVTTLPGAGWPPLLGSSGPMLTFTFLGVSFVIFSIIPKTTELIKSIISGKPFEYGTGIGELGKYGGVAAVGYGTQVLKSRKGIKGSRWEDIIDQTGQAVQKNIMSK